MNVICSVSNEEITHEQCLDCALKNQGGPCGYDYAILKRIFAVNGDERPDVHVTDLTSCLRKAWYSKKVKAASYVHEMLVRSLGTLFHAGVESKDPYLESEMKLSADGLVGTADVVYKDGRLLDVKTTRWLKPSKLPYGSHELQVNIYAHMLREMGFEVNKLQIQYVDMSGPTSCRACRVPVRMTEDGLACPKCGTTPKDAHMGAVLLEVPIYDPDQIASHVKRRSEDLNSALEMNMEPQREPGWICGYCSYIDECNPANYE